MEPRPAPKSRRPILIGGGVALAAGLVSAAVLYFVFMHGLGLTFPAGPFEP